MGFPHGFILILMTLTFQGRGFWKGQIQSSGLVVSLMRFWCNKVRFTTDCFFFSFFFFCNMVHVYWGQHWCSFSVQSVIIIKEKEKKLAIIRLLMKLQGVYRKVWGKNGSCILQFWMLVTCLIVLLGCDFFLVCHRQHLWQNCIR